MGLKGHRFAVGALGWALSLGALLGSDRELEVVVLVGEPGQADYAESFQSQAESWESLCHRAEVQCDVIGLSQLQDGKDDKSVLLEKLDSFSNREGSALWLILVGHGTHDGRDTKFNLRGEDLSTAELRTALTPLQQEIVTIHTGSASGAFVKALSGPNRVVISATKSADEIWATRFGSEFVGALDIEASDADQDGDGQISLLEAWLHAATKVARQYEEEGRLATEHSVLEDNGDGVGTRSEAFSQLKLRKPPENGRVEGQRARQWVLLLSEEEAQLTAKQRSLRDSLERELEAWTSRKPDVEEGEYYSRLEGLLRDIAAIYDNGRSPDAPAKADQTDESSQP
jgi:hypothetical protein